MMYSVNGVELEADDQGYLLEAVFDDEAVRVIAAAENIVLTDAHWEVINYLRDQYREEGATPELSRHAQGDGRNSPRGRQQIPVRPVPHRSCQAGAKGRRAAPATWQGRDIKCLRCTQRQGAGLTWPS
jgi:hypothetical protein